MTGPANGAPQVLLMSPPVLGKLTDYAEMFSEPQEKSAKFAKYYELVAKELGCYFLDTAKTVRSSDLDGVHWDASEHHTLGGQQLQLNALNADILIGAKAHPERHKNLIVRVWGWSCYF